MEKNKTYLVVDAGNTRIKTAIYKNEELVEFNHFSNDELPKLKSFLIGNHFDQSILSSVRSKKDTQWLLQMMPNSLLFQKIDALPILMAYETPETLGADRLANAIAAYSQCKGNALIVDIGTCVKFDFVSSDGSYQGGSISPGIHLRYKSLNDYTAALPLINNVSPAKLIGKSTVECMHSGVMCGIQGEINTFIKEYKSVYQDLTIFITGGDAQYFDFDSKSNIFVNENLTLQGLFITIQAHAH